jgi:hypothetical protein
MKEASSDTRKMAARATSSGDAARPIGVDSINLFFQSTGSVAVIGVSMSPGWMELTRMFSRAY